MSESKNTAIQAHAAQLAAFCEKNLELHSALGYHYESLSACILDCVYSLRAHYPTTVHVVDRYAEAYMHGDRHSSGDTVSMLLANMDAAGGAAAFADGILKNRQKIGGILKSEVCCKLALYLRSMHIETIEDFRNFESQELLEIVIRSVKGIGDAGVNYLFMLAGDPNRCKPDVHIHRCVRDACGQDMSNDDCQTLFRQAVDILKERYPALTVRVLDNIIWNKYSGK